jgi:hypothetical protein
MGCRRKASRRSSVERYIVWLWRSPVGINWHGVQKVHQRSYTCGFCGVLSGSNLGWREHSSPNLPPGAFPCLIYICTGCSCPTFFNRAGNPTPGAAFGDEIYRHTVCDYRAVPDLRGCVRAARRVPETVIRSFLDSLRVAGRTAGSQRQHEAILAGRAEQSRAAAPAQRACSVIIGLIVRAR